MSEETISELLSYADTVEEDDIVSDFQDAISTLEGIYSDLEEKRDCVVTTLRECASSCDTYENLYDMISEDIISDCSDKVEKVLEQLQDDVIAEHELFSDLCKEGYPEFKFSELVKRLFRNAKDWKEF